MSATTTQYLDKDGLDELWGKIVKFGPYFTNHGTGSADGWAKLATLKCLANMNSPIVLHVLNAGKSVSSVEFMLNKVSTTTPTVASCKVLVDSFADDENLVGYTYADVSGVREYTFWKKRGDKANDISVKIDCPSAYNIQFVFPTDGTQSSTEPTGIVYGTKVYDSVSAQTAYTSQGSATKVPQITTNEQGQVTGITEVTISGVTPASHTHGDITDDGKLGSTANLAMVTSTGGKIATADMTTAAPSASGYALAFIDSVSQDSKGKISATKKSVTVDSTYSADGTNPVNGKAIADALDTLDVDSVGGSGKYISAISESNGKISATSTTMDTAPTANSQKAVTSGGIKTALDGKQDTLDSQTAYTSKGSATKVPQITTNSLGQVTGITEVTISGVTPASHSHGELTNDGKIGSTADLAVVTGTSGAVTTANLTAADPGAEGTTLTAIATVSQDSRGKITATKKTIQSASTSQKGVVQLNDNINSTSTTEAATANAVKKAYDKANGKQDPITFDGTYNASTNKAATVSTVTTAVSNAVNGLDATVTSSDGTNVQVKVTETDGKITAVNVTTDNTANKTHAHGNIQSGGTLQTNDVTIASGDKLVITDSSDSNKVARASISFDGSTTTQALTKAGTWATFNNYSHPAGSAASKTGVPTADAAPAFGGTFKVNQITTDSTSHVSAVTERTITIPNTTGNASTAGLTKLYTGTGTNTDGTMTQNAIKTALDEKSATTHTHYNLDATYASTGLPNYNEDTGYKLFRTWYQDFCIYVFLYEITEFFNGVIVNNENSSFFGEVSAIRTGGYASIGYAKVAASISYSSGSTVLASDSNSCMPVIAKQDVTPIQTWSSSTNKCIYIGAVGTTVDISQETTVTSAKYTIIDCSTYTQLYVNAGWYNGTWPSVSAQVGAVWAFLDADNKVLSRSSTYGTNEILTVPTGAKKFVCNTYGGYAAQSYVGIQAENPRYFLGLDIRYGSGNLSLFGRFYTRTTATSTYSARPLLLTSISNIGNNSQSTPPVGWTTYRRGTHTTEAGSADKLATARKLAVNLANTSTDSTFDGSADQTGIKVSGTLAIGNGGTGQTSAEAIVNKTIQAGMGTGDSDVSDSTDIITSHVNGYSSTNERLYRRKAPYFWSYIKGKMSSDSGVNISGNAATATSAGKLTTARKTYTDLGTSSNTTTKDWSGDTVIPVYGTLPIANGGTGATTATNARTNLDVYSKSEVDSMLTGRISIVTSLPATGEAGVIYFVGPTGSGSDKYEEYVWDGSAFVKVGEKSLDLSNYVNTLTTTGSGNAITAISKSGNTITATIGNVTFTQPQLGQGYGTCGTAEATAAKAVTLSSFVLKNGGIVAVKFTYALCASATLDVNSTGAKPVLIAGAAPTSSTCKAVQANDIAYFIYDGTSYHFLGTERASRSSITNITRSGTTFTATRADGSTFTFTQQDNNTTYTQEKLGQGYGTCTTAEATAAKEVSLTNYELVTNGIIAVKFTYGLCASATLNVNSKGAKPIYIHGAAVSSTTAKEVLAGDIALFMYDGSQYQFLCSDRLSKDAITGLSISGRTITYTKADGTTGDLTTQDTTYSFDGTYNSSTNKAATVSTVTNKIAALDVSDISGFGAGKTLATLTETDGKIAATFQNISITKSQVSDFPTSMTPTSHAHGNIANGGTLTDTAAAAAGNDYVVIRDADSAKIQTSTIKGTDVADAVSKKHSHSTLTLSTTAQAYDGSHTLALPSTDPYTSARTPASHTHGNITNGGALQTTDVTIANGDKLVVTDASDSNKVARTSVSFDGSTTTKALTQKGTFESFAKSGDITTAIQALDVSSAGGAGKYISAISETDGKISATATTMDTTPTESSTNAVTSGGIKTALDGKANDSDVVHKTGTETISGAKTFSDASSVFSGKCASDINGVPLSSAFGSFRTELGVPTLEERAIIEETFANQLECLPKANAVYETSPKGTETWTTLAVSDSVHNSLWGGNVTGALYISKTVDFRITINAPYYCWLNFLYFYATGNSATFHIKLERKLGSSGAWSVVSDTATASLGWPGHNTIRHDNLSFGGTYSSVRLTLYMVNDGGNIESYPSYYIQKIRYYGGYPYKADPWIRKDGSSGVTSFPKGITSGVAIPVSSGGTGKTSVTADSYLKGNGTGALVERTYAEVRTDLGISAGANKVEASTTNGKIKIDGTETTVYTHPTQTAQSAKGSATKVPQITTDSTGHVTGITEVTITGVTPASHTHGNITNGGALQTNDVTIASGDKLVITDSSDSSKVARASISFDGSTATKALTQKGTWETFNNYTHPSYTATTAAAKKIGCDATGHVVFGDALAKSDVGLGSVVNTGDSATPVSGGTTKFTTGGAYTELAKKANKADSVYYVDATFPMDAYSSSKTYSKWTSGAYTSANSCVYNNYAYYCNTAITTAEAWNSAHWTRIPTTTWNGTIDGVTEITAGLKIAIKLPGYGGGSSTKLNINGLGEKDFRYNTSGYTTHYAPGLVVFAAYNGSYWGIPDYNSDSWVTSMGGYCSTAAATQEKGVSSSNTVLTAGMAMIVRFTNANSYDGKITMNVNSQGAKDIWINGAVSSSSNKTLPAGEHWCFYDGSKWSIWTNGTVQFKGVHAESYESKFLTDANLAIPPYITTSNTGGANADFVVKWSGSNVPDVNYNWHIHSIVFRESTNYRLTQIATASSNTATTLTYERNAWSSDGTTWTFAAWTEILTSNSTVAAGKISGTVANATKATSDGDGNTISSTYLKLSGGTMTGTINTPENNVGLNFRAASSSYYTTMSYQTSGNEALVFASTAAATSFMFVNGENSVANHASNRWQSLTPGLQIKNNCVSIGKLIGHNVTPTYKLEVNGTVRGESYNINDACTMQYNASTLSLDFVF